MLSDLYENPNLCTLINPDNSIVYLDSSDEIGSYKAKLDKKYINSPSNRADYGARAFLFEHVNGQGRTLTLQLGGVDAYPDLIKQNFNDITSSIRIINNNSVTVIVGVFQDVNYKGKSIAFVAMPGEAWQAKNLNNYTLSGGFLGIGKKTWNDRISSARIHF